MRGNLLGSAAASFSQARYERVVSRLEGKVATVTGSVASIPKNGKFYLDVDSLSYSGGDFGGGFKIYVSAKEEFELGDRFTAIMYLYMPRFPKFDMSRLIASKGAPLMGSVKQITKTEMPKLNIVNSVRKYILFLSDRFFSGNAKALFRALTVGDKSLMGKSMTNDLAHAGISHIAAISGLHISLLGYAVYSLVKTINKKAAAILSVLAAIFFSAAAGGSPSAVRAAIMFSFYMASDVFILRRDSATALCLAAFLMALLNPYVIFDMGFILSFSSIAGISLLSGRIKDMLSFLPPSVRDSASTTVSAQIFTIPITLIAFNELSVYSVATNIVISFIFPYALYLCFILSALAFIPLLSAAAAGACAFLLDAIAAVAHMFASLPLGSASTESFGVTAIACYAAIALMLIFQKKISAWVMGGVAMLCAAALVFSGLYGEIKVYELGDYSCYMVGKDGSVIIADSLSDTKLEELPLADAVLLSSCEGESPSDLADILALSGAGKVYLPEGILSYSLANEAKKQGADVLFYPKSVSENEEQKEYARYLLRN